MLPNIHTAHSTHSDATHTDVRIDERFDLGPARLREAQRRRTMLGDLVDGPFDAVRFRARAPTVGIPAIFLQEWHRLFLAGGINELLPAWGEIGHAAQTAALAHYRRIEAYAEAETISSADIWALAQSLGRSYSTAQHLLMRYRMGGLWGLTPQYDPFRAIARSIPKDDEPKRDLGALDENSLVIIYERYNMLGELARKATATDTEVNSRAAEVSISPRTLWYYLREYRKFGLAGLAPKQRSDKGRLHNISEEMVELVRAIRLSNKGWPVRKVHEVAKVKANDLQELAPTLGQVRKIIANLPKPVILSADGRDGDFRNNYRVTAPINHSGVVYQIDHCLVDVLVRDKRGADYSTPSGGIRPWLTAVIDSVSRVVVTWSLSYDRPYRHTVTGVIRAALIAWPGGVPHEIWVDNGKDLVSIHVRQLTRELDIELHPCAPHQPQHRGILERFFGTLNTRLWSTLPGYIASNTVDRNPSAKAALTIQELEAALEEFLNLYHHETHASMQMSPLDYWNKNCMTMPVDDVRRLDMLLKEPSRRRVVKQGIKFDGRIYWHTELATIIGEDVLVRVDTRYQTPDEIEVFHDGHWLCTAFALDSARGQALSREEIAVAQQMQRQAIRKTLDEARDILSRVENSIPQQAQRSPDPDDVAIPAVDAGDNAEGKSIEEPPAVPTPPSVDKKPGPDEDFLMRIANI